MKTTQKTTETKAQERARLGRLMDAQVRIECTSQHQATRDAAKAKIEQIMDRLADLL